MLIISENAVSTHQEAKILLLRSRSSSSATRVVRLPWKLSRGGSGRGVQGSSWAWGERGSCRAGFRAAVGLQGSVPSVTVYAVQIQACDPWLIIFSLNHEKRWTDVLYLTFDLVFRLDCRSCIWGIGASTLHNFAWDEQILQTLGGTENLV